MSSRTVLRNIPRGTFFGLFLGAFFVDRSEDRRRLTFVCAMVFRDVSYISPHTTGSDILKDATCPQRTSLSNREEYAERRFAFGPPSSRILRTCLLGLWCIHLVLKSSRVLTIASPFDVVCVWLCVARCSWRTRFRRGIRARGKSLPTELLEIWLSPTAFTSCTTSSTPLFR